MDRGSKRKGGKISVHFCIVSDKFLYTFDSYSIIFFIFYHIFIALSAAAVLALCAS
jgi:hypothetical protein